MGNQQKHKRREKDLGGAAKKAPRSYERRLIGFLDILGFQRRISPKLEATRAFAQYVGSLPANERKVNVETNVHSYRVQRTPFGLRLQFMDAAGVGTDPQPPFAVVVSIDFKRVEVQFPTGSAALAESP